MYLYVLGVLVNDRTDILIFCIVTLFHCDFCYVPVGFGLSGCYAITTLQLKM